MQAVGQSSFPQYLQPSCTSSPLKRLRVKYNASAALVRHHDLSHQLSSVGLGLLNLRYSDCCSTDLC